MSDSAEQLEMFPGDAELSRVAVREAEIEAARLAIAQAKEEGERHGGTWRDLTGERFGKLVGVAPVEKRDGGWIWLMQCDCGETIKTALRSLNGRLTHCGCMGVGKARRPMPGGLGVDGHFTRAFTAGRRRKTKDEARSAFDNLYGVYRHNAKKRGLAWRLTRDQFEALTQGACEYCKAPPAQNHHGVYTYNGVDRRDSARGYTLDNVVSCCGFCNRAKSDYTEEEFRAWIKRLRDSGAEGERGRYVHLAQ